MSAPVVVVGGGITGLAAAHELVARDREVVVLEADDRIGGKIHGSEIEGSGLPFAVDEAADGFLRREPEMTDLCTELGLGDDLVTPAGAGAYLWADGDLRPVPPSVLGAPFDPEAVTATGLVSAAGVEALRAGLTADLPPLVGDASVGEVLRPRVGDEVFERLVDTLLGGINCGTADEMSIRANAGALADAAATGGPFGEALRAHVAASAAAGPVFNAVRGGSRRIVDALGAELGDRIRTATPATGLARRGGGWTVHTPNGAVDADRVILTGPGWVTAELLAPHAPEVADAFAGLHYADAVLVTFVVDRDHLDRELDATGFLVPRDQGLLMTACSWSSSKWAHYDDGTHAVLRVSAGRTDDPRWLAMDQESVAAALRAELVTTMGLHGPVAVRVSPWRRSLPQYRPGHLDRCDEIDAALDEGTPGVAVAGASMRGLGLPACVRQGRAVAARI